MNRHVSRNAFLAIFFASCGFADQVTMKNGDRLSGSIVKYDGKNLVLKSEFAGAVTIAWDAVTAVTSTAPLHVGLKDGQVVVGTVTTTNEKLEIATQNAGTVTAARETVQSIRSKDEQAAYEAEIERYRNPRLTDLWAGFVDFGFASAQGNSKTSSLNVGANASRATSRDKITVNFTSLYASNSTTGTSLVTANAIRGGINYSLNLTPKLFAFGNLDMEFDEFQDLDLRFAPGGGFGYHALKTEKASFDLFGGAVLDREFFSTGLNRTSGEAQLGEEYVRKLSASSSFREKLVFFPNVTNTGNYRMNFDTSLVTSIRKWLAWQVTFSDRYLSNPVGDRKKNDVLFSTGFRLTFAR
jgi:putative salt-induced outer membrane protein